MKLKISRIIKKWKYGAFVIPGTNFQSNNIGDGRRLHRKILHLFGKSRLMSLD